MITLIRRQLTEVCRQQLKRKCTQYIITDSFWTNREQALLMDILCALSPQLKCSMNASLSALARRAHGKLRDWWRNSNILQPEVNSSVRLNVFRWCGGIELDDLLCGDEFAYSFGGNHTGGTNRRENYELVFCSILILKYSSVRLYSGKRHITITGINLKLFCHFVSEHESACPRIAFIDVWPGGKFVSIICWRKYQNEVYLINQGPGVNIFWATADYAHPYVLYNSQCFMLTPCLLWQRAINPPSPSPITDVRVQSRLTVHLLFIGSFASINSAKRAELVSPTLPWEKFHEQVGVCVRFSYQMKHNSSKLRVGVLRSGSNTPAPLWELRGDHGPHWSTADVKWATEKDVKVIFSAGSISVPFTRLFVLYRFIFERVLRREKSAVRATKHCKTYWYPGTRASELLML